MAVRSIYCTNNHPVSDWGSSPNESGCAVAIGTGSDGRFSINVIGYDAGGQKGGAAYALMDRAELQLIHEALGRELANG